MKALIFDIYKGTTHDGPGMRDTVFFKGCPISCRWCHNPEGIEVKNSLWYEKRTCIGCSLCHQECKNGAITFDCDGVKISKEMCVLCGSCVEICPTKSISYIAKEYTLSQLVEEILKDKEYFSVSKGGVTASGGEALMQSGFLYEFFTEMKKHGVHTALDTTGFCDSDKLLKMLEVTDTVLYDLKLMDSPLHKKYTGVDNKIILENIIKTAKYIENNNKPELWIRTPIIPGVTDNEEVISQISSFIKNEIPTDIVTRWELCAFNNSCNRKYEKLGKEWHYFNTSLIKKETMTRLKTIAEKSEVHEIISSGICAD